MHRSEETEKDRPERAASDGLFLHIIDEMPLRVVFAVTFVAFFFVWGGINNLLLAIRRDTTPVDQSIGVWAGIMVAAAVPMVIWLIKRRAK